MNPISPEPGTPLVPAAEPQQGASTLAELVTVGVGMLLLVALAYSVRPVLSPFVLLAALVYMLYPFRQVTLISRLAVLAVFLFALWFIDAVFGKLVPFLVAFLLAYLLNPAVTGLQARGVPRWASSLAAVLLTLAFVVFALLFIVPPVIQQFNELTRGLGRLVADVADLLRSGKIFDVMARYGIPVDKARDVISHEVSPRLESLLAALFGGTFGLLSGMSSVVLQLVNIVIVPVLVFYMLMDFPHILERFALLVPLDRRDDVTEFGRKVDVLLGRYFRGALTVALIQAIISSVGLWLLGVRYALVLGMTTGLLTLVPFFGIITSLVVSSLVAAIGPDPVLFRVLGVVVLYLCQNLLETTVLSPRILGRQVGLHPVVLLLSLLVFGFFLGFLGLLIAVPTTSLIIVVIKEWQANRRSHLEAPV